VHVDDVVRQRPRPVGANRGPKAHAADRPVLVGYIQTHHIADLCRVLLIVSVELFIVRDHAPVETVRLGAGHLDHDGLVHPVGGNYTHN